MSDLSRSSVLLRSVGRRLRMAAFGRGFYVSLLALCGLYAAVLLAGRLTGALPLVFDPASLALLPAAALLAGLLSHRRPTVIEAARRVDVRQGTKDLFLTAALLEGSAGEYQPLVMRDAEQKAASIRAAEVVPFVWSRPATRAAAALAVLAAGVLWFPQFDPFGQVEAAEVSETRRQELAESRKATQHRAEQLQREENEGEESDEVKKALEGLMTALKQMKPVERKENFDALSRHQKELGEKWRKLSAEKLKNLMNQASRAQQFGGAGKEKLEKWTRELQEGATDSLQKELSELQDELQRLMAARDPVERAERMQKLRKRLRDLEEFAGERADSKPLTAALERAMQQLEMAKMEGLSTEALEALTESLELAKLELQEVAQSAQDLKALEEALKVLQMAKQLNEQEQLDGEACASCLTLADYEELYAQLMAGMEIGEGLGGEGIGRGGEAPEDDSVETGFKSEQATSPVVAGKVLLSLKTKGLSDRGDAQRAYRENLATVKQGLDEAIEQEQIPPGYREAIQRYFDTIEAP